MVDASQMLVLLLYPMSTGHGLLRVHVRRAADRPVRQLQHGRRLPRHGHRPHPGAGSGKQDCARAKGPSKMINKHFIDL